MLYLSTSTAPVLGHRRAPSRWRGGLIVLGALVLATGCERPTSPALPLIDAGVFGDAGVARCASAQSKPVAGTPPGSEVRAVWANDHYLLAWIAAEPGPQGQTQVLQLARVDLQGRVLAPARTLARLWNVETSSWTLAYDARGGRATVATLSAGAPAALCKVRVVDRHGRPVRELGPLNDFGHPVFEREALGCWAAPVGEAIAGVWAQRLPDSSDPAQLYLQWYGAHNMVLGRRHALGTVSVSELSRVRVQSIGRALGIAFPRGGAVVTAIAMPGEAPREIAGLAASAQSPALARVGESLLVASGSALQVVDAVGAVRAKLPPLGGALLGALRAEDRWLAVVRVGAQHRIDAYDESWTLRGQEQVSATADSLLLAGPGAAAFWRPSQPERVEPLLCASPSPCTAFDAPDAAAPPTPAAPSPCSEGACQLVLRLGYLSGRVLGYRRVDAPLAPIDLAQAKLIAAQHIADKMNATPDPERVLQVAANDDVAVFQRPAGDFGGFCAVSLLTGEVLAAGGIVWMGQGSWWTPTSWSTDAQCLAAPSAELAAIESAGEVRFCGSGEDDPPADDAVPTSVAQAWSIASSSDVALPLAAGAPSGLVYQYTPSVGTCQPGPAEVLVFVSRWAP